MQGVAIEAWCLPVGLASWGFAGAWWGDRGDGADTARGGGGHLSVGQMLKYFQPIAAQASQRLADAVLGASLKCKFMGPTPVLVRIGGGVDNLFF